jgi:hypothetical protein
VSKSPDHEKASRQDQNWSNAPIGQAVGYGFLLKRLQPIETLRFLENNI